MMSRRWMIVLVNIIVRRGVLVESLKFLRPGPLPVDHTRPDHLTLHFFTTSSYPYHFWNVIPSYRHQLLLLSPRPVLRPRPNQSPTLTHDPTRIQLKEMKVLATPAIEGLGRNLASGSYLNGARIYCRSTKKFWIKRLRRLRWRRR